MSYEDIDSGSSSIDTCINYEEIDVLITITDCVAMCFVFILTFNNENLFSSIIDP